MLSLLLLSLLTKLSIEILYFYLAFTECKSKGEILYSSVSDKTAKGRRLSSPWSPSAWSAKNVLRGGDQKKTEVLFMPKTESWFGTASFTKKSLALQKKKRQPSWQSISARVALEIIPGLKFWYLVDSSMPSQMPLKVFQK